MVAPSPPAVLVLSLLLLHVAVIGKCAAAAAAAAGAVNVTFRPGDELRRYRRVQALLRRLNKPSLRTIQSPDGDVIDCVPAHLQPAFDHPRLRGQRPLGPPARPSGHHRRPNDTADAGAQLWAVSGASCPEGSVPVRRITEADVLRASSARRFGRAPTARARRRDSVSGGHEHAVGYVAGDEYYGARASINVWAPTVSTPTEFSLSQIWVIGGSFGNDLNTIEAGWQVREPTAVRGQLAQVLHLLDDGRVPDDGVLQPPLLRVRPDQQQDRHGGGHLADVRLQRRPVRHQPTYLEGPEPRQLVAGVRVRGAGRLLAVVPVQPPGVAREHGAVRRRGGGHARRRGAHGHADGERPLPRGRLRAVLLLPQPGGGGLGQQPHPAHHLPRHRRPPQLLRHTGRSQRRMGELLLLRRTRKERQVHLALPARLPACLPREEDHTTFFFLEFNQGCTSLLGAVVFY